MTLADQEAREAKRLKWLSRGMTNATMLRKYHSERYCYITPYYSTMPPFKLRRCECSNESKFSLLVPSLFSKNSTRPESTLMN